MTRTPKGTGDATGRGPQTATRVRAVQLPELRRRLLRFVASWTDQERSVSNQGDRWLIPGHLSGLPADQRGRAFQHWYEQTVRDAALFWVSADLTDLAEHAGPLLPQHRLHPQMLPAPTGLLMWARPISCRPTDNQYPDDRVDVTGILWAQQPDCVWVQTFTNTAALEAMMIAHLGWDQAPPDELAAVVQATAERMGPLQPGMAFPLAYGTPWGQLLFDTTWGRALATLTTTWLLMGQTLTVEDQIRPDRTARRRLARQAQPDPTVTTIALRHRTTPDRQGGEKASAGELGGPAADPTPPRPPAGTGNSSTATGVTSGTQPWGSTDRSGSSPTSKDTTKHPGSANHASTPSAPEQ